VGNSASGSSACPVIRSVAVAGPLAPKSRSVVVLAVVGKLPAGFVWRNLPADWNFL